MKAAGHKTKRSRTAAAVIAFAVACVAAQAGAYAENITFKWGSNTSTVDIPSDLVRLVNGNKSAIESALQSANVSTGDFQSVAAQVKAQYSALAASGIENPYTTATNALDGFCSDLCDTLPNTQTLQNVWAPAWIGKLVPGFHFGLGVNAGAAMLEVDSLLDVASALSIDVSDLPSKLVFPTATLDARLGGIILPFDIGLTISALDTSKIGALDDALVPCGFEYFSIGGDIRYCLIDAGGKAFNARVSATAGGYYTSGSVDVKDSGSESRVGMDFKSTTLFLGAQASVKALCLVPFLGGRLALTKTKVDWDADADWNNILGGNASDIGDAMKWGILPAHFDGSSDSGWKLRPQVYGGLGIDIFAVDITVSASYDFAALIPGGAVSVRFSI